jgi:hypothetical protein
VLRSVDVPGIWLVKPLQNGNLLATSNRGFVHEINRQGETVWEWTRADAPGYTISNLQTATRLPSGNTIINNWRNQFKPLRFFPWASPALMRLSVPQPTKYSGMLVIGFV